jgi:LmbE family N-acetylglucosaminyl deacetylase
MAKILCVAAHADDEILGCGATLARHVAQGDEVKVIFVADGVGARHTKTQSVHEELSSFLTDARQSAAKQALKCIGVEDYHWLGMPDNQLDSLPLLTIVQAMEPLISTFQPSWVYTHHGGDLNIDHRLTCQAVLTACRPLPGNCVTRILSFEVLSSTEWAPSRQEFFIPNVYCDCAQFWDKKLAALAAYANEIPAFPHARSLPAIAAQATARGASVGLEKAEAFCLLREIVHG